MRIDHLVDCFSKFARQKDTRVLTLNKFELFRNPEGAKRLAKHMGIYNSDKHDNNVWQLISDILKENERLKSEDLVESLDDKMKFYM
jgi:hypothetical protein